MKSVHSEVCLLPGVTQTLERYAFLTFLNVIFQCCEQGWAGGNVGKQIKKQKCLKAGCHD